MYSFSHVSLFLIIPALTSLPSFALPEPTVSTYKKAITNNLDLIPRASLPQGDISPALSHVVPRHVEKEDSSSPLHLPKRQAGLAWGPVYIGNLKLTLTNPHDGYAGPKFPMANHVNFHVDRQDPGPRGTYSPVVNLHIVKYAPGGATDVGGNCLYVWDSVTGATVFDNCFDEFGDAIAEGVAAIKAFVDTLLQNADAIAYVAVLAALAAALVAAIGGLAAVAVV
ncbi:MAG: hypothetical protein LQ351_008023 [Letrouitia transgressa]|nr:MAG: hypothetical protein LQ351_008023 [Letrouitia transgressa]